MAQKATKRKTKSGLQKGIGEKPEETLPKKDNAGSKFGNAAEASKNLYTSALNGAAFILKSWSVVLPIFIFGLVIYLKSMEEYFSQLPSFDENSDKVDYYNVLLVTRLATISDIKKSFRQLSFRWHPDRNEDCEFCEQKLREIGEAYSVLSDPERRKVYDDASSGAERIKSASVDITSKNYQSLVSDSDDVWVIEIYNDYDPASQYFSKIWELAVSLMSKYVRFGRINALTEYEAIKKLPLRVRVHPAVIMVAKGMRSEMFPSIFESSQFDFRKWIEDTHPQRFKQIDRFDAFKDFFNGPKKHKLIHFVNRQRFAISFKSFASKWSKLFDICVTDKPDVLDYLASLAETDLPSVQNNIFISAGPTIDKMQKLDIKIMPISNTTPGYLEANAYILQLNYIFDLSRHNMDLLCNSTTDIRIYCLILFSNIPKKNFIDNTSSFDEIEIQQILRKSFDNSQSESETVNDDVDEDARVDERIHIQTVRLNFDEYLYSETALVYKLRKVVLRLSNLFSKRSIDNSDPSEKFFGFWQSELDASTKGLLVDFEGHRFISYDELDSEILQSLYPSLREGRLHFQSFDDPSNCPPDKFSSCLPKNK